LVHVFSPEKRKFYDIERLWSNAPRIELSEAA
jgi:ribosomal silencing factor RsfS